MDSAGFPLREESALSKPPAFRRVLPLQRLRAAHIPGRDGSRPGGQLGRRRRSRDVQRVRFLSLLNQGIPRVS